MNTVSMVIGSWGSYNECNERALGSKWLDFDDYDGIDEELFVQDIEGIPTSSADWDNTHPQEIFELIKKSGVLDDEYKYELMEAYCEVRSFDEWSNLVDDYEENWDRDIVFYKNMTMLDVAYEIADECYDLERILGNLTCYFDYKGFELRRIHGNRTRRN